MAYTVKKLSEISGVTVRTLHFYEEACLLMPAYYGSNGYRYYEEKQLLELQQILFFKELGFTLKQIRKVLGRSDFDQLAALYSHKKALSQEWEKIGWLIKTIDKTINHLKGKKKMKDEEMFNGFITVTKGKGSESYFAAEEIVGNSVRTTEKPDHATTIKTAHAIWREIVRCIEKGQKPTSDEVQRLIKKHHAFTEQFNTATKEVYKAYAQLYQEHPAFRQQLDPFHPQLADFMGKAMVAFANRELN
jgi:MerR family transcriptional regulator, thiopeptide resistance regulator